MEASFWKHLEELRRCLIRSVLAILIGFLLSLSVSKGILNVLTSNAEHLVFLRPTEALMAQLKVALLNGIVIAFPVILWQTGRFLWPALYPKERKTLLIYLPFAFILFVSGLFFGYFIVARLGYRFLLSFGTDILRPMISLESYMTFILSSMLACGLVFLLPIAMLLLTQIGLLRIQFLCKKQRAIIIGLLAITAILTPTVDVFSMLLVFMPLLLLFEVSLLLAWLSDRHKKAKKIS